MSVSYQLTRVGGHLGEVRFRLGRRTVEPLATAPWCDEPEARKLIPLLRELRGDFFCAPFGHGPACGGEEHPPHGESANGRWQVTSEGPEGVTARLKTSIRPGRLTKRIEVRAGETNLYQEHLLEGYEGAMCLGHHAMLDFRRNGAGLISTSRLRLAQVVPVEFEHPAAGGYSSLRPGAWFRRLDRVPLAAGGLTDLSHYPAREGFEDLVMLRHQDAADFAWVAVVFPEKKFVWFALKNPGSLASTVLWHSNGGRHYAPWNGRHRGVLGVEDVTAYFHLGLAASVAENPWRQKGVPTALELGREKGLRIPYIMGVVPWPEDFGRVREIRRMGPGIRLVTQDGKARDHAVDTGFLQ